MSRALLAAAGVVALLLAPVGAEAGRGHGSHGFHHGRHGHHGHRHHGGGIFFHGSFFWPPYYPYSYYPYPYYPYPYYYGPYTYGSWSPSGAPEPSEPDADARDAPADPLAASYGLVQLQGVPDGADVELDGRFWLVAEQLDRRWLALPQGEHRLVVRARGAEPVSRRVEIEAGRSHVVRMGSRRGAPS